MRIETLLTHLATIDVLQTVSTTLEPAKQHELEAQGFVMDVANLVAHNTQKTLFAVNGGTIVQDPRSLGLVGIRLLWGQHDANGVRPIDALYEQMDEQGYVVATSKAGAGRWITISPAAALRMAIEYGVTPEIAHDELEQLFPQYQRKMLRWRSEPWSLTVYAPRRRLSAGLRLV